MEDPVRAQSIFRGGRVGRGVFRAEEREREIGVIERKFISKEIALLSVVPHLGTRLQARARSQGGGVEEAVPPNRCKVGTVQ